MLESKGVLFDMPKRLTTEEFIRRAKAVHGDKYDYSKVEYKNRKSRVCIICPIHGEFYQLPNSHLIGCGCPSCSGCAKYTTESFIQKAREVHGDKYDYSKVEYKNSHTEVCIICPKHGEFWQKPSGHLSGYGCAQCAGNAKLSTEDFIKKAKMVHGLKYGYSKVKYVNRTAAVCIICPKHGSFWQGADLHLKGCGCPFCRYDTISQKTFGKAKNKLRKDLICGFGINDYSNSVPQDDKAYRIWRSILTRCYSTYYRKKYPTYIGCSVCEEWRYFSNFKRWFDENYIEGYALDKDLTKRGNKIYCPEFCAFIPQEINVLTNTNKRKRGKTKSLGVRYHKGRYIASVSIDARLVELGAFDSEQDAFNAYKKAKESYLKEKARAYYIDGKIPYGVYRTLVTWEVHPYD